MVLNPLLLDKKIKKNKTKKKEMGDCNFMPWINVLFPQRLM